MFRFGIFAVFYFVCQLVVADEVYYWTSADGSYKEHYKNSLDACKRYYKVNHFDMPVYGYYPIESTLHVVSYDYKYEYWGYILANCEFTKYSIEDPARKYQVGFHVSRLGRNCPVGELYNSGSGACEGGGVALPRKQLGAPALQSCAVDGGKSSGFVGNPINLATGNKYQEELDYSGKTRFPLDFIRYYNSATGQWTHTFGESLSIGTESVQIEFADGRQSLFSISQGKYIGEPSELGILEKSNDRYTYKSPRGNTLEFDAAGVLIKESGPWGSVTLTYAESKVEAISNSGTVLKISIDAGEKLKLLKAPGLDLDYSYDKEGRLVAVNKAYQNKRTSRLYSYEATGQKMLLTGIADERGVKYAIWTYDATGRAVSSEHAGGAGRTTIKYQDDGSVEVQNELGRITSYKFLLVNGMRLVQSIEGEPSANCPLANTRYTYTNRGKIASSEDAKGYRTTYAYDSYGLEVLRTEAEGTSLARVVKTDWDHNLLLPIKVSTGNQATLYSYDGQGREVKRQISPP